MKYGIIFSSDYDFQVLSILSTDNLGELQDYANQLYTTGKLEENNIDHYDSVLFEDTYSMNAWLLEQVGEGRKLLHKEETK